MPYITPTKSGHTMAGIRIVGPKFEFLNNTTAATLPPGRMAQYIVRYCLSPARGLVSTSIDSEISSDLQSFCNVRPRRLPMHRDPGHYALIPGVRVPLTLTRSRCLDRTAGSTGWVASSSSLAGTRNSLDCQILLKVY